MFGRGSAQAILSYLVLLQVRATSAGRDCRRDHPQTKVCRADFVLKLTVKSRLNDTETSFGMTAYEINIKSQILISQEFAQLEDEALRTLRIENDVTLLLGTKYLISGTLNQGTLQVDRCSWIEPWAEVSHRHKSSLRKKKFDCACRIRLWDQRSAKNRAVCHLPSSVFLSQNRTEIFALASCYRRHAHCRATKNNAKNCVWSRNNELEHCLRTESRPKTV